jgi:lipase
MRLHVHEWGDPSAPPVVCLHGITAHGARFRHLAEDRLASRFRVVAPDLRGHGRSGWEPPWRLETYVADVAETLDGLGIEQAFFVGHSFGGRLTLELAAHVPGRISRAVLLDPAIDVLPHVALDSAEDERRDRVFDSLDAAVDARLETNPDSPRELVEADFREHYEAGRDGRFRPRYSQACVVALYGELATQPPPAETLRAPALIVYAPAYGLVRNEHLEAYAAATIVPVPGRHMVIWDAYEQTADAIDAFLS